MLSMLLGMALWGLIIGGIAVVVKLVLLTFDYIKGLVSKKLQEKRTKTVLQTSGNALLKKIAESPETINVSAEEFQKMTNELAGTYINAGLDENNNIIEDQVTHIHADKVEKKISDLGTILIST